jgi:beta-glucosidase
VTAGVDMEMEGDAYRNHLESLVKAGRLDVAVIDRAVARILRLKFRLGLFEHPYTDPGRLPPVLDDEALAAAKEAALQSVVMLQNHDGILPLQAGQLRSVAVIGPLADAPHEQLGTWTFDGNAADTVTPLQAIEAMVGQELQVRFAPALQHSRDRGEHRFEEAVSAARDADVAILFLGEEAILSGEAHCRADIGLPGAQATLVRRVAETGTPVVAVVMAGRPLTLLDVIDQVDALLFAWHPGTMGGPAIADLLFGRASPSGKLPVTFPRMVGQVPIYYSQKNTGKPPAPGLVVHIDEIGLQAAQTSLGMTAFHLDAGYQPLFPFGFGLSYGDFHYRDIRASASEIRLGETVRISAELSNHGPMAAEEVVQLYIRDLVGSITRPVRELKGFRRVRLEPGQTVTVDFDLHTDELAFCGRRMQLETEPGEFHAWIGGSSLASLRTAFRVVPPQGHLDAQR